MELKNYQAGGHRRPQKLPVLPEPDTPARTRIRATLAE